MEKYVAVLEKHNRQLECDYKRQCQNLEEVLSKKNEDLEALEKEHESKVTKQREEFEKEKREIRRKLEHERVELEEKCVTLQEENRRLHEQLRGSSADVETVREEFNNLNDEVAQMRQKMEDYRREVIEMEKDRNELQTRLESAEEDAESKDIELEQTQERYQALLDQKRKLEHSLHEWTGRAKKFEDLYNVQCKETEKAVQIMHKCVSYSNTCKEKGTKLEHIARKQQELLKIRDAEMVKLQLENERLTKEVEKLKEENKSITTNVNDLKRRLQEQSDFAAEKETIITNLNKQLSELRLLVNPGGNSGRQSSKDHVPNLPNFVSGVGPSCSKDVACVGDRRAVNSFKTPAHANILPGKENRTPFLHPKYSSRT